VPTYQSWGRYPRAAHARAIPIRWRTDPLPLDDAEASVLPFAMGRSYGDSCLNDGGVLLDVTGLDRLISFDQERGVLRCEAGVTLAEILALVVPRGWFLPVVPGTRWVSVGGAIANDIHGKNHHRAGTFGCHVSRLELLRSTGERLTCSLGKNSSLFRATIGGLGLTGVILWAEIQLKRVTGSSISMERIRCSGLDQFLDLTAEDQAYEYSVAWVDCIASGRRLGRGVFMRGDHAGATLKGPRPLRRARIFVPFDAPDRLINRTTIQCFNALYYRRLLRRRTHLSLPYDTFFFPLDGIRDWGRLYGRRGFLQYQCVVPDQPSGAAVRSLLARISDSAEAPSLAVLKKFGDLPSPGLLSFPRPGITLAVDFPFRGRPTLELLEDLDGIVRTTGGAVYPAKDARMSPDSFRAFFPGCAAFAEHVDPRFSSSFWRRVYPA